jgi:hypothetical protein
MSYKILRGFWCHITVLNVHAPTEYKIDDVKDSFYAELERVFDKLPKYHMKTLLGDFKAKVDREDIFKLTIGNESLHKITNDNAVRLVNFATSKTSRVKSAMFPQYSGRQANAFAQLSHRFHMERFNLKKLNEIEGKEQFRVEVSNRFAALEDLDTEVEINSVLEMTRENINISAKEESRLF